MCYDVFGDWSPMASTSPKKEEGLISHFLSGYCCQDSTHYLVCLLMDIGRSFFELRSYIQYPESFWREDMQTATSRQKPTGSSSGVACGVWCGRYAVARWWSSSFIIFHFKLLN